MKFNLAIFDTDIHYLERISAYFSNKYADEVVLFVFDTDNAALENLINYNIDVCFASPNFTSANWQDGYKGAFAYFVDDIQLQEYNNKPAVCKYQRVDDIYEIAYKMFNEKALEPVCDEVDDTNVKITAFASASGGVGSSTLAIAFASKLASLGKRTLYLNFEQFAYTDNILMSNSEFTFSNVIYAVKANEENLMMKIDSFAQKDASGLSFFKTPTSPLDIVELSVDDIQNLVAKFKKSSLYDYIILDVDFAFDDKSSKIIELSDEVVLVSNGSDISNNKFINACNAFTLLDNKNQTNLRSKFKLFYNKFINSTSKVLNTGDIEYLGGVQYIENATQLQIINTLQSKNVFDKLL